MIEMAELSALHFVHSLFVSVFSQPYNDLLIREAWGGGYNVHAISLRLSCSLTCLKWSLKLVNWPIYYSKEIAREKLLIMIEIAESSMLLFIHSLCLWS